MPCALRLQIADKNKRNTAKDERLYKEPLHCANDNFLFHKPIKRKRSRKHKRNKWQSPKRKNLHTNGTKYDENADFCN